MYKSVLKRKLPPQELNPSPQWDPAVSLRERKTVGVDAGAEGEGPLPVGSAMEPARASCTESRALTQTSGPSSFN